MVIRGLAIAASLVLAGCAAADQMRERIAGEWFKSPEETATIRKSTPVARTSWRSLRPIDIAKIVHQKPPEKASEQRVVSSDNSVSELPLDASSRQALFRRFLQWRERQLSAPQ
jgi:hypothetical protein